MDLYANRVSNDGLFSYSPVLVKWNSLEQCWFDEKTGLVVTKAGYYYTRNDVTFASEKHQEVTAWTLGVRALKYVIKQMSDGDM